MSTIELECPGCAEPLEIDTAFAGGVCRCADCGTLMTVPAADSSAAPQKVTRPERPDAPPGASEEEEEILDGILEDDEPDVYTTEDGQEVQITNKRVPTAKKKKKAIKAGILVIFAIAAVAMLGFCFMLVQFVLNPEKTTSKEAESIAQEMLGHFDPNVNPFKMDEPNFLGIKFDDGTVVVVDASAESQRWLSLAKFAVEKTVTTHGNGMELQFVIGTESQAIQFPDKQMRELTDADAGKLPAVLDEVYATGKTDLSIALSKALVYKPEHVIVLTGKQFEQAELSKVIEVLNQYPDTKVQMITVGDGTPAMEKYITERKGRFISIPMDTLVKWYQDA